MKNVPKKIYLQVGFGDKKILDEAGIDYKDVDFQALVYQDITWSDHRINDSDICYELKKKEMSQTAVKTTYKVEAAMGSTEIRELYCVHSHSMDYTKFYKKDGSLQEMSFHEWSPGNDLWDAVIALMNPYKGDWGRSELKEGIKYFNPKEQWKTQD